jgi:hypothetical protein
VTNFGENDNADDETADYKPPPVTLEQIVEALTSIEASINNAAHKIKTWLLALARAIHDRDGEIN